MAGNRTNHPLRGGKSTVSSVRIQVPVTPGEKRRYNAMARRMHMTVAELCRSLLDREYEAGRARRGDDGEED